MPRRLRDNLIGYPQHIVQRGHNRVASFFGNWVSVSFIAQ